MVFRNDLPQSRSQASTRRSVIIGVLAVVVGCSDPKSSPNVGSNSNWLTACVVNGDCAVSLACNCGACSKGCSSDSDCSSCSGTVCLFAAEDAAIAQCRGSVSWASQGICLPPCASGGCAVDQACALGVCVSLALPNSDFCQPVANVGGDVRTHEDDLVLAFEQLRKAGGVDCGTGSVTGQLPFVRIEPRLTCAARVLAADIAANNLQSLTDSAGRNTTDRYALAGYQQRAWSEGYVRNVSSASAALQTMLNDSRFCPGFVNTVLVDIGVGFSGSTYVITMATE
jgi:hypothetical protein